jgi:uncharacterized protein YkwD
MRIFLVFLLAVFVGLSATMFIYLKSPPNLNNIHLLPYNDASNSLIGRIQKEVLTPPPLTGSLTDPAGTLTVKGIFEETNKHRSTNELPGLTLNETLNQAAAAKIEDMFANQYFEHISPDSTGPSDLAESVGYQYLRVGENLALGNYRDNADVVQAWMDSPGHRDNILNSGFSEIGIAVGQGQFEEHNTWLAVQTFGLPSTVCPEPDPALQDSFDQKKLTLDTLSQTLKDAKGNIDNDDTEREKAIAEIEQLANLGNEKIEQGNSLVEQGNKLLKQNQEPQATRLQEEGQKLQQEGQALIQQASEKQDQFKQLTREQNQQRSNYNSQVSEFNSLNEQLTDLAEKINQQIRTFNSCVENY